MDLRERFESMWTPEPNTGCYLWFGHTDKQGYGVFYVEGKAVRAHRFARELWFGPIPNGLVIDHLCRNRACVNPEHLECVTNKVNVLRGVGIAAQHARKALCVHGHELSGDNLSIRPNKQRVDGVRRVCLACDRARKMRDKHKRKPSRKS